MSELVMEQEACAAARPAARWDGRDEHAARVAPTTDLARRQEEFEALALPLNRMLFATALRWFGDAARAEDLVQEAYLRAWQNFDRFEPGTNFRAWVFKILQFVQTNERRKCSSHEIPVDFLAEEAPVGDSRRRARGDHAAADVDWETRYADLLDDTLKRALDRLNPKQREAFVRVPLGDLSYEECAAELGVPVGTVMSRLARARSQLRADLRAYAPRGRATNVAASA